MTGLEDRVLQMLETESLVAARQRVVVALSGGADSVALTALMRDLAPRASFVLVGVAHLNHQLRDAARDDERFCRDLADRWSLSIEVEEADVGTRSRRDRISVEQAGHRERYEFFDRVRKTLRADRVATAHTRDDQAETFLMRLVRGAGPAGLSGIRPRSGHVIRPLLDISRAELRTYLARRGQTFCEDETNADVGVTRNRVRHELIPFLEDRFSPAVVDALVRDANIARHDAERLDEEANTVVSRLVTYEDGTASLGRGALARQPLALGRRVVKQILEGVSGTTAGFREVGRFLDLVTGGLDDQEVDFPGCRISLGRDRVVVRQPPVRRTGRPAGFEYFLRIPGDVDVPEAGVIVSVERSAARTLPDGLTADSGSVYVSADCLTEPLIVRSWRAGDALKPLGLGGRKKVQDLFVDRKVARKARQMVPIVTDATGGIVWVVGHTLSDDFRLTPGTEGMLTLKVRKLGGAG